MNNTPFPENVQATTLYPIFAVYQIYALRCRDLGLDEEKHALKETQLYYDLNYSLILPEEAGINFDEDVEGARTVLDQYPM